MLQRAEIKRISFILCCHKGWRASSNPLCSSDRKNGDGDQVRFINHQICSEQSIDLEAEVEEADVQTQWLIKEGETEKSLAQWPWSFHFTLSPFPDGPQESRLSGWWIYSSSSLPLTAERSPASAGASVAPSLDIYICCADKSPSTRGHFWGGIELLAVR